MIKCEICTENASNSSIETEIGVFKACPKCFESLKQILEKQHVEFLNVPKELIEESPLYCNGWFSREHVVIDPKSLIYTSPSKDMRVANFTKLCRNCFIEFVLQNVD